MIVEPYAEGAHLGDSRRYIDAGFGGGHPNRGEPDTSGDQFSNFPSSGYRYVLVFAASAATVNESRRHFVDDMCEAEAMSAADRRGLLKLMLKMPALRGRLQVLSARDEGVLSLCGAFDDATDALEHLRLDPERHRLMILEYENICAEIEQDIIKICMSSSGSAGDAPNS